MKKYVLKYLPEELIVWGMGFITAALAVVVAYLSGYAVDALVNKNIDLFLHYIFMMLATAFCLYILNFIFEVIRARTVQKIITGIRDDIAEKIANCSYSDFNKNNASQYLAWLQADMATIEVNALVPMFLLVLAAGHIIASAIALFLIHWILAVGALSMGILLLVLPQVFNKTIQKSTMDYSMAMQNLVVKVMDVLSGFNVLFSFNKREIIEKTVHDSSIGLAKKVIALTKKMALSQILIAALAVMVEILMIGITGYLAFKGLVAIGAIMAASSIGKTLVQSFSGVVGHIVNIKSVKPIFEKFTTLNTETTDDTKILTFNKSIELKNVSFTYEDADKKTLDGLNLRFELGKKYGIIGASGSGKTTLFKLINGMLENYSGEIEYDGTDIKKLNKEKLREQVAYIDQNVFIFNNSLRDNICLGTDFSEAKIQKTIEDSALEDFINECENGLDTIASENGKNFSGGQRQRIALARALIHGQKILLIDEGTSALDKKNAQQIEECLLNNRDLTVIMISHHFSDETKSKLDAVCSI
ncbi:ABC transporter ATP-binding protein [Treponema phagedenis]|uniref:ABC transporter ATP-binding protein n=1 Tax=Treponema phagedenis TaxID=162 RepID=UPI0015A0ED63|nr:ABC transporter ATP-binding protein [Treponema phagedenis]NVP24313.1 ABC transporter ATP-binding protein [Treponema phagedenis]QLC59820.1 ABC transporter ATP-binding protein [Treponema phagedenis]